MSSIADRLAAAFWAAAFLLVPATIAWHDSPGTVARHPAESIATLRPPSPPPPVEPLMVRRVDRDQARSINAAVPFSTLPNPAARPFHFAGSTEDLSRATDCLAAAQYYEAGDDPVGQRAVAQVVLNRLRHPAFPKTVCGVVFQGSERRTGCQFTFTCDGALARIPAQDAWDRARTLAGKALSGAIFARVGYATHYHTDWVVPYWSDSLDKVAAVNTHLFYRWTGWWGTPPAFQRSVSGTEPVIAMIAALSPAHRGTGPEDAGSRLLASPALIAAAPQRAIGADMIGKTVGGARLMSFTPATDGFIVILDPKAAPDSYPAIVAPFCAGRPRCRILAWTSAAQAARGFPPETATLPAMAFSYIQDSATSLQRALWNCALTPRSSPTQCMRRPGATPPPAPPKPRPPETVVITQP